MTTDPRHEGRGSETAGEPTAMIPDAPIPFTIDEARAHTKRVQGLLDSVQESVENLVRLINEANEREAWKALAYPSWPAYVRGEFTHPGPRLDYDNRRMLVDSLGRLGMSTRAIAPVVGASQATVTRDLRAGESDESPAEVTGLDGKVYTRPEPEPQAPKSPRRDRKLEAFDAALAGAVRDVDEMRRASPRQLAAQHPDKVNRWREAVHRLTTEVDSIRKDLGGAP